MGKGGERRGGEGGEGRGGEGRQRRGGEGWGGEGEGKNSWDKHTSHHCRLTARTHVSWKGRLHARLASLTLQTLNEGLQTTREGRGGVGRGGEGRGGEERGGEERGG